MAAACTARGGGCRFHRCGCPRYGRRAGYGAGIAAEGGDDYAAHPAYWNHRGQPAARRVSGAGDAAAGGVGGVQGLVVLEAGEGRTPDYFKR